MAAKHGDRLAVHCGPFERGWSRGALLAVLSALAVGNASAAEPGSPLRLITEEEAALEDAVMTRGESDYQNGPIVQLVRPEPGGEYEEPFEILVHFLVAPSGHAINESSLKVLYMKLFNINITSRLREYVSPKGIQAPAVELPPGRHSVQIYLEDVERNASQKTFTVTVRDPEK